MRDKEILLIRLIFISSSSFKKSQMFETPENPTSYLSDTSQPLIMLFVPTTVTSKHK